MGEIVIKDNKNLMLSLIDKKLLNKTSRYWMEQQGLYCYLYA